MELLQLIKKSLEQNQIESLVSNVKLLEKFECFINHTVTQIDLCDYARIARNEAQLCGPYNKENKMKAYILQDICQSIINLLDLDYQEYSQDEIDWLFKNNFDHNLINVEEITNLFE